MLGCSAVVTFELERGVGDAEAVDEHRFQHVAPRLGLVQRRLAGEHDVGRQRGGLRAERPQMHVVLTGEPSLHEAQSCGDALKAMLGDRFGIAHATLELECHDCGAAEHGPAC